MFVPAFPENSIGKAGGLFVRRSGAASAGRWLIRKAVRIAGSWGSSRATCTLPMLASSKTGASLEWLIDRRHRRSIPHRMERCGYVTCRNPNAADGLWFINGRRHTLYGKANLPPDQRVQAARLYATTPASDEAHEEHVSDVSGSLFFSFFLSRARFCCGNSRLKEKEEN